MWEPHGERKTHRMNLIEFWLEIVHVCLRVYLYMCVIDAMNGKPTTTTTKYGDSNEILYVFRYYSIIRVDRKVVVAAQVNSISMKMDYIPFMNCVFLLLIEYSFVYKMYWSYGKCTFAKIHTTHSLNNFKSTTQITVIWTSTMTTDTTTITLMMIMMMIRSDRIYRLQSLIESNVTLYCYMVVCWTAVLCVCAIEAINKEIKWRMKKSGIK